MYNKHATRRYEPCTRPVERLHGWSTVYSKSSTVDGSHVPPWISELALCCRLADGPWPALDTHVHHWVSHIIDSSWPDEHGRVGDPSPVISILPPSLRPRPTRICCLSCCSYSNHVPCFVSFNYTCCARADQSQIYELFLWRRAIPPTSVRRPVEIVELRWRPMSFNWMANELDESEQWSYYLSYI